MSLKAVAWRANFRGEETHDFRMQVTGSTEKELKKAEKELVDWTLSGQGYDAKNDRSIRIFTRSFDNRKSCLSFTRGLSFEVKFV